MVCTIIHYSVSYYNYYTLLYARVVARKRLCRSKSCEVRVVMVVWIVSLCVSS